ncbi:MAG TPA: hypothetical protein VEX70_16360 [Pyrinomonadaceae bacterium]|nr:hypothetical protein [Pyrinomonadaceae bacterium]
MAGFVLLSILTIVAELYKSALPKTARRGVCRSRLRAARVRLTSDALRAFRAAPVRIPLARNPSTYHATLKTTTRVALAEKLSAGL